MGLFSNLFKSKEQKLEDERSAARTEWHRALGKRERFDMEQAALSLGLAELPEETVAAYERLITFFPDHTASYENNLGIHYWGRGDNERAMRHYIRSYHAEEGGGGCAESNILELCQSLAEQAASPKDAVQHMLRYFRVCTKAVDPNATFEEIDLMSIFRERPRSLASARLAEAEAGFDMLEELLEEVDDAAFAQQTRLEMKHIQAYFGIEGLQN